VRLVLACLACATGCGFHSNAAQEDAGTEVDASVDAASDVDAAIDAPPDMASSARTRAGLIGLWEFDDAPGTMIADTSDHTPKVPLAALAPGAVTFADSTMTPVGATVVASSGVPHFNREINATHAVTLEVWVQAASADQGTVVAPVLIAGVSRSPMSRNISLMQAGTHWLARVRVDRQTEDEKNGKPDLISTTEITAGSMTHLVVVADATQRVLYVNGKPDTIDPAPRAPASWEDDYPMVLGIEWTQSRQWLGTFALVALFEQALGPSRIVQHYDAGPNAH
jgi:Concanavalin A-like lectin/glucanases superfamily